MAKFVFQLEGVLKQRTYVEQERQRELAAVQTELAVLEGQLRKLDQSVQQANMHVRMNHLTGSLDMTYLTAHRRFLNATQRHAIALAQQMAAVQIKVEEARKRLLEAAKGRKIIEKLREKQHARWKSELERKELLAADEAATQFSFARACEDAAGTNQETATT